jgi:hypothetical protein
MAASEMMALGGVVSLATKAPVAAVGTNEEGAVLIRRQGGLKAITVAISIGGVATPGADYEPLPASVEFPFGITEVLVPVRQLPDSTGGETKTITIDLLAGDDYQIGDVASLDVRLVHENLLDVRSFGALGDGVANDTAAIQQAIETLEQDPEYNGIFFPSGTYRMTSAVTDSSAPTGSYRLLKLGRTRNLEGRDLVLRGEPGSVLFSDVSPIRANMFLAIASFRSLRVQDLTFEQDSGLLWPSPGVEPNGSDGITVVNKDLRRVEMLSFESCRFINCHGAVRIYGAGYDLRGKCGLVLFRDCEILNPYGSNTMNGQTAWGGGQQIYLAPWIAEAIYENNLFEGGGEDMTDAATAPGGVLKDGGHFGSPLRLVFRNNTVRRMGVESLFQLNDNAFLGKTLTTLTVPPPDGLTGADAVVSAHPSTYVPGELIVLRTPLTPGVAPSNVFLEIKAFDPVTRILTVANPGHPQSGGSEGVVLAPGRVMYLDERFEPTIAEITGNVVDGTIPPGGLAAQSQSGICFIARATVEDNYVTSHSWGIYDGIDVRTPLHPAQAASLVRRNVVFSRSGSGKSVNSYGITMSGPDSVIVGNYVVANLPERSVGIIARGRSCHIAGNTVFAPKSASNGYDSPLRTVGIGIANGSALNRVDGNATSGFDIGVGPVQAYQSISYYLGTHSSFGDVIAVDPRGIIVP